MGKNGHGEDQYSQHAGLGVGGAFEALGPMGIRLFPERGDGGPGRHQQNRPPFGQQAASGDRNHQQHPEPAFDTTTAVHEQGDGEDVRSHHKVGLWLDVEVFAKQHQAIDEHQAKEQETGDQKDPGLGFAEKGGGQPGNEGHQHGRTQDQSVEKEHHQRPAALFPRLDAVRQGPAVPGAGGLGRPSTLGKNGERRFLSHGLPVVLVAGKADGHGSNRRPRPP